MPVRPFPGITVFPDLSIVEIQGDSCLTEGWLEQIACSPNTREYEALVVVPTKPSLIHAALLMAGLEPGSPGRWSSTDQGLEFVPPQGDGVDVLVRYEDRNGAVIEEPIRTWIADHQGRQAFPPEPWVFGGSRFDENPEWMGPGEHYVADMTGSIIGLVTFGDEVVGFRRVFADEAAVQAPEWDVATDHVPPVGTPVTLILKPHPANESQSADR